MKFQINITLQIHKQINKQTTYEISKSYWRYILLEYSQQVGSVFILLNLFSIYIYSDKTIFLISEVAPLENKSNLNNLAIIKKILKFVLIIPKIISINFKYVFLLFFGCKLVRI